MNPLTGYHCERPGQSRQPDHTEDAMERPRPAAQEASATPSERSTGLVFAVVLGLIGFAPLLTGAGPRSWAVALGVVFALVAWRAPRRLARLTRAWAALGEALHRVVSPIVLGAVYFLLITPTGLLRRHLPGGDALRLKFDPDAPSYWIERRPPGPPGDSLRHPF
ncbi:MAG: SxtJ family membrane protein [Gammaproteobacteria bacterium]